MKYHGSCSCGNVLVGLLSEPCMKYNCHCSHCRNFLGKYIVKEGRSKPPEYLSGCAVWKWQLVVRPGNNKDGGSDGNSNDLLEYEYTNGSFGLFSLSRGRCKICMDPLVEYGGRLAILFAMVNVSPFQGKIKPTINLHYDSGYKNSGPTGNDHGITTTIFTDSGSVLYEIYLILTVAIPQIPYTLYLWMFGDKTIIIPPNSEKKRD